MHATRRRPAAAAAALGACLMLYEESRAAEPTPFPAAVVTATRLPQPAGRVLADLRVIDAATIDAAGTATLTELLQAHGGVEISANGGPGQVSAVFLRGSNANHVVLLVDGVRMHSATTGTNAFEHIPLAQIERIEVLRGPASSLYGADAIGGVIQIFTRKSDSQTRVRAGAGARRTRDLTAGIGRRLEDLRFSLNAGWRDTRGFSTTNADHPFSFEPDDDGYRNRNLGIELEHGGSGGHALALRLLHSDGDVQFDAGPGSDDRSRQRLSSVAIESRNRIGASWSSLLRVARSADHLNTTGAFPSEFDTDQDQLTWQNDIAAPGGQVALGYEWRRETVGGTTAYSTTRRYIRSVFASYAGESGPHGLGASLRYDDSSQFGGRTTGNLAYGWSPAEGLRISAAAGTAFKAPSFNDLYFPLSFGFSGNRFLRPERSKSAEIAARYQREGLRVGLTVFENRIRDLIAVDPTFTTVVNVADARIRGGTLGGEWADANWRLRAEWTHQRPEDRTTDGRPLLVRRARNHGSAGVMHSWGAWRAGIDAAAAGARFDSAGNEPESRMGRYALLHLHAARVLTPEWTLSARLENATDKRYELARGYNTPRRGLFVALEYAAR